MSNPFFLVVSAPSGTGKTTIVQEVLARDSVFDFSVSTTTRSQRKGEIPGQSYYFVTDEEFDRIREQDGFLEWAIVHGHRYGTTKKEIDRIFKHRKIPILDIDVQGALQIREKSTDAVFVFIIPPSFSRLEERLRKRKTENEEEILLRLENAQKELGHYEMYDYIVINDSLVEAVERLLCIIRAEQCRRERYESLPFPVHDVKEA